MTIYGINEFKEKNYQRLLNYFFYVFVHLPNCNLICSYCLGDTVSNNVLIMNILTVRKHDFSFPIAVTLRIQSVGQEINGGGCHLQHSLNILVLPVLCKSICTLIFFFYFFFFIFLSSFFPIAHNFFLNSKRPKNLY